MIIILKQDAPEAQVREFCHELTGMGFEINDSKGHDTHILGLIATARTSASVGRLTANRPLALIRP